METRYMPISIKDLRGIFEDEIAEAGLDSDNPHASFEAWLKHLIETGDVIDDGDGRYRARFKDEAIDVPANPFEAARDPEKGHAWAISAYWRTDQEIKALEKHKKKLAELLVQEHGETFKIEDSGIVIARSEVSRSSFSVKDARIALSLSEQERFIDPYMKTTTYPRIIDKKES